MTTTYPAFEKAVSVSAELISYRAKAQELASERAGLQLDTGSKPFLQAATELTTRGRVLDDEIKAHRFAIEAAETPVAGLWHEALAELRPIAEGLEIQARELLDETEKAAHRLFAPITGSVNAATGGNPVVLAACGLVGDIANSISRAVNGNSTSRPLLVSNLKEVIDAAPARIDAIKADRDRLVSAAVEIERRFPALAPGN